MYLVQIFKHSGQLAVCLSIQSFASKEKFIDCRAILLTLPVKNMYFVTWEKV